MSLFADYYSIFSIPGQPVNALLILPLKHQIQLPYQEYNTL